MKQLLHTGLFFLLIFSGCTGLEIEEAVSPGINGQTIVLALINGEQNAIVRSETPGEDALNENLVERLDVFFFNQAGECLFYPSASQMNKSGSTLRISIPEETAILLFNKNLKVYIVANCILSRQALEGKSYPQLIETVQGVTNEFNPPRFSPQPSFLMDGILPVNNLTEASTHLGEVILSRAASKIKVNIIGASVSGYTPVEAHIRMSNYLESTTLGQEAPQYNAQETEYEVSEYRPIWIPGTGQAGFETDPFYSYSHNWKPGDSHESHITIRVKWYKEGGGAEPKDYYYRIPVKELPTLSENGDNIGLKRNYAYTFNVNIGALGGLDPDKMVNLTPDFVIKDWTTNRIVARLNQYDYLVVSETDVQMHDITAKSIRYISSKPVSVEIDSVFHYTYLSSGEIRIDNIPEGASNYPLIRVNEATTSIDIQSPVPVNYVPVMMYFKVKNTAGLYYNVRVVQYPRQYITSEFSNKSDIDFQWYKDQGRDLFWSNNGEGRDDPPMKNFNLYTITTTSVNPEDDFMIGGDMMHDEYNLTDDKILYVTKKDAATNRMVSPKFVIGSQRGITSTATPYVSAQIRCAYYMEGTFDRGTWRIPTEAEMLLISKLQMDGNSAINELFKPSGTGQDGSDRWWTARVDEEGGKTYYYSVRVTTGELVRQEYSPGKTTASVRCVRDVWKN